jgi:hypothetical protein
VAYQFAESAGDIAFKGAAMAEEQPKEGTDDRPKIFKNMTAWIGGATAVIVALGGLATAYRSFMHDNRAQSQTGAESASAPAAQQDDGAAASSTATGEDPASYTTDDGGTLRWIEGMWIWTTKDDDKFRYKEVSNNGVTTVAILKGGGENGEDVYLRWPNAGGSGTSKLRRAGQLDRTGRAHTREWRRGQLRRRSASYPLRTFG